MGLTIYPPGSGDVNGPASATDGHIAVFDGATGKLIKDGGSPAGGGDVTGPGSSTDNAIARFDSTTGKIIQNSAGFVDDSGNIIGVNMVGGLVSIATAAATTTLTVASKGTQVFTGSTTQIVVLPVVTTLPQIGYGYRISNNSSGVVTVNSSGSNAVQVMAPGARAVFVANKVSADTTAAAWDVTYIPAVTQSITNGDTNPVSSDAVFDGLASKAGNSAAAGIIPKTSAGGVNLEASSIDDSDAVYVEITGAKDLVVTGAYIYVGQALYAGDPDSANAQLMFYSPADGGTLTLGSEVAVVEIVPALRLIGQDVTFGANDSGGTGFRALVVPNA